MNNLKKYKSFFRDSLLGFIIGLKLANFSIDEFLIMNKKIINIIFFLYKNVMYSSFYNNSYFYKNYYILIIILFLLRKRIIINI